MSLTDAIRDRRGPIAKVWLAAHMERKLSKTQTLQTDIEESVEAIIGQEVEVMALRVSGQLLLGVVRIYSRKAKYLLDDCNEALMRIKMTFRPGVVDMTADQLVSKNSITLQPTGMDLDLFLPDLNWDLDILDRPPPKKAQHLANKADITLPSHLDLDLNLQDPSDFDLGPSDGIGSQNFELDFDLGSGWGDEDAQGSEDGLSSRRDDDDVSVEMGLDAPAPRHSLEPNIFGQGGMDLDLLSTASKSRAGSEHPFNADAMDIDDFGMGGGLDLTEMGIGFEDIPDMPQTPAPGPDMPDEEEEDLPQGGEKTPTRAMSRFSSPLTEMPGTPPPETPAAELEKTPTKPKRKPKEKKQIIDSIIELADGGPAGRGRRGAQNGFGAPMTKDVSNILKDPNFIPHSSLTTRFLEIRHDPLVHFMPTTTTNAGSFISYAPPGLPPQLLGMFSHRAGPSKRSAQAPRSAANKRRRTEPEEEIEAPRRDASAAPSQLLGSDILGRAGSADPLGDLNLPADDTLGLDEFQMDIPIEDEEPITLDHQSERARSMSRLSTPGIDGRYEDNEESYADAACPIVEFDLKPTQEATQNDQVPGTDSVPVVEHDSKGYSKNTVKALSLIRNELKPTGDEDEDADKVLSFNQMSHKASRRAASSFFFELLVLATRDCVQVEQDTPFENIEVRAKDKLWEHQAAEPSQDPNGSSSRLGSLAPSQRASSMAATPRRGPSGAPSSSRLSAVQATPSRN
ncbi:Rec8 like protein-domain-containing protein [Pterulicium gracile]|uniref:Rec8 like protein-domain-containing protein n=1 Tax=Pterulicium gracile TaxID=1884261 RepID=A0A5C3Q5K6_9AGAR|nr:Rec8 like protein-domain-containing protein [Pterula gracilis]